MFSANSHLYVKSKGRDNYCVSHLNPRKSDCDKARTRVRQQEHSRRSLQNWSIIKYLHNLMVPFRISSAALEQFPLPNCNFLSAWHLQCNLLDLGEMCFWFITSAFITALCDKEWIKAQIIRAFDLRSRLINVCQTQAEHFWQPRTREEDQRRK